MVTATQLREAADRLIVTGQQQASDPEILVVMDAGYDVTRLAWPLADLPVILAARIRSDRVFYAARPWASRHVHGVQAGVAGPGNPSGPGVRHGA